MSIKDEVLISVLRTELSEEDQEPWGHKLNGTCMTKDKTVYLSYEEVREDHSVVKYRLRVEEDRLTVTEIMGDSSITIVYAEGLEYDSAIAAGSMTLNAHISTTKFIRRETEGFVVDLIIEYTAAFNGTEPMEIRLFVTAER